MRRVPQPLRTGLLLLPALSVVIVLFGGGLYLAVKESLGVEPVIGETTRAFDAYRALLDDREVQRSIALTFRLALMATVLSAILAVASALLIRRLPLGRRLVTFLFQLNLPVPHVVGALSAFLLLDQAGLLARVLHAVGLVSTPGHAPELTMDGFGVGILAEYVWKETPFIGVVVLAALAGAVAQLEDVASTLGAGPWRRFRHVVLPLITPAVLSTSVIVFAFSFGSYEVPYLLGRNFPTTLPVVAYQSYTQADITEHVRGAAINVTITLVVALVVLIYLVLTEKVLRQGRGKA
ncbi:MAG: ABC transporter permease subunit [Mycobacteriales bacterium]